MKEPERKHIKQTMKLKLILSLSTVGALSVTAQSQRNILFIAVDDLKPLLGCYGDGVAKTPNIDKLASQGTLFTNAYCQQAVSGPSRASLLTGMSPDNTQVWDLKTLIRDKNPEVITLPQHFKANGYETVGIGKIYDPRSVDKQYDQQSWSTPFIDYINYLNPSYGTPSVGHYQSPENKSLETKYREEAKAKGLTRNRDINEYILKHVKPSTECADVPDNAYGDGATVDGAIEYLQKYDGSKPLFMAVGFKKPHLPFCAPKNYWDMYKRDDMQLAQFTEKAAGSPDWAYHNSGELQSYSDIPPLISFSDINNAILPDSKAKELIHGYYACVSYMDAQVGKLISTLKQKGLDKNTTIVLWGDHGWHLGDHGLWNKHSNFENATHVPLLIIDHSSEPRKVSSPVEFLDIYPTLCDLANIDKPAHLDGKSLSTLVKKGQDNSLVPYAVSQYPRVGKMGYSIRTKNYRYTVWVEWKNKTHNFDKVFAVELYDYTTDPLETKNLASEESYKQVLSQMEGYWNEFKSKKSNK